MSAPTALTKLRRETLAEQATARLVDWMRESALKPGETLPSQGDLATRLGVSRTVIREAIQALVGRGVVEVMNGKGAVMRDASHETLSSYFSHSLISKPQAATLELMEVRRALEVQAARLAALRRTDAQVVRMQAVTTLMGGQLRDPPAYSALDLELHFAIAEAAQNTMLVHMIWSIRESARQAMHQGLLRQTTDPERKRIQAEHEAVVEAIYLHDPDGAAHAMENHFDKAVSALAGPANRAKEVVKSI